MADEEDNPFPDDASYQDGEEKEKKYEKIPIKIYGMKYLHLFIEHSSIKRVIHWGGELSQLELGIGSVIRDYNIEAKKSNLEDLFCLVYAKSCRKNIEKQLGRYANIERLVVDNHKK